MAEREALSAVVLDGGSETLRAGFAVPEQPPPVVAPMAVRAVGESEASGSGPSGEYGLDMHSEGLQWPVRRGAVQDFDAVEAVWHHALYDALGWVYGEEGLVLLTEPALVSRRQREEATQVLFEGFNVQGLFLADQPTLSLYAAGKVTGCVVDMGAQTVDVCPVSDGCPLQAHARVLEWGGDELTAALGARLPGGAAAVPKASLRQLKHMAVKCAPSRDQYSVYLEAPPPPERHTLPDGNVLEVGEADAFAVAEALFDGSALGPRWADAAPQGVVGEVCTSVMGCAAQIRQQLFENVLLCGGVSATPGLAPRVERELERLAPASCRPSVVPCPEYMPEGTLSHAAWTGGAVLAKVVFQQNQHITRAGYNDYGPYAVHNRQ
mmetsp:Transcript_17854/g.60867  ORF Transcript_17854/g.60867 Transcript_17854/m.60867 type:complete len:380 (-) Transcript_17854:404-1543(-)